MAKSYVVERFVGIDERGQKTFPDIEIPDGKWVAHTSSYHSEEVEYGQDGEEDLHCHVHGRKSHLVGPEPQQRILLNRSSKRSYWSNGHHKTNASWSVLIGDTPFGIICQEQDSNAGPSGLWFNCARQVHKGELGRRPLIARPRFVREAPISVAEISSLTEQPIKARDRKRGKTGWVRLTDLAKLVRMTPEEVIRHYFEFTDAKTPHLQVRFAERPEEIQGQRFAWRSWQTFHLERLPELFHHDQSTIWVRQGWTLTVLYLKYFGHVPELADQQAA